MTQNIKNPSSVTAAIKNYRQQCVEIKGECERSYPSCHIVGRGVELLAIDETGERNDALGGPDFIPAKELTAKLLKEVATLWAKYSPGPNNPHTLAAIHLSGGFDIYDSFADCMENHKHGGIDYDIYGDYAGQDIPLRLLS